MSWATTCDMSNQLPRRNTTTWNTYATNGDRRVPEEEELVQAGDEHGPADTDQPGPECVDRDRGVIGVRDGGTNLWVRRVVLWGD